MSITAGQVETEPAKHTGFYQSESEEESEPESTGTVKN